MALLPARSCSRLVTLDEGRRHYGFFLQACSVSQGSQRETWNACKVLPVPRQQHALVRQSDSSDQAIAHAYRLPPLLEGSSAIVPRLDLFPADSR